VGYQDVTLYKLKFEGRDGLEVTAAGLSTGDLLDLMDLVAKIPDDRSQLKLDGDTRHVLESLMETLAENLVEWNIEDRKGQPVPTSFAGVKSLKPALVMDIVTAWMGAQNDVDDDLGKDSGSGATSELERSLTMEPRSPSRSS